VRHRQRQRRAATAGTFLVPVTAQEALTLNAAADLFDSLGAVAAKVGADCLPEIEETLRAIHRRWLAEAGEPGERLVRAVRP
jgi:hypothetical protein